MKGLALALSLALVPLAPALAGPAGPSDALVTLVPGSVPSVSAGIDYELGRRQIVADGQRMDFDLTRVTARVGCDVVSFLHVSAGLGWSQADEVLAFEDGEGGLAWDLAVKAAVMEHDLDGGSSGSSRLTLYLAADYRAMESNQGETDLSWDELRVIPSVTYRYGWESDAIRARYQPSSAALSAGIVFSQIDGDIGPVSVRENRDFGYLVAAEAVFRSGWQGELAGTFYGSHDYSVGLALGYRF